MKQSLLEMGVVRTRCRETSLEWAFDVQVLGESTEALDQLVDCLIVFGFGHKQVTCKAAIISY